MSREPSDAAARGLLIALFVAALATAGPGAVARAQDRSDADLGRAAYLAADFPAAATAFDAVLTDPAATRDDAVEAHRHLATLRYVLGEPAAAERHARASVALDDAAVAVEGSPAEVEALFTAARAERDGRDALELASESEARATTVTARLAPWALDLEGSLTLECQALGGEGAWATRGRGPSVALEVPSREHEARCIAALAPSERAAPWLRAESRLAARGDDGDGEHGGSGGDDALVWGLVGGGAALAVGAAIVIAVVATSASSSSATFAPNASVPGW